MCYRVCVRPAILENRLCLNCILIHEKADLYTLVSGGSRISCWGAPTHWGALTSEAYTFQQKCMQKRKKWTLLGGACRWHPPGSTNVSHTSVILNLPNFAKNSLNTFDWTKLNCLLCWAIHNRKGIEQMIDVI